MGLGIMAGVEAACAEQSMTRSLSAEGRPRQVVFLMTDATRKDMLNCYRTTGLKTPHLDGLASEGIRYERAYTTQPVCTPARSAIFTGTYPHNNGAWGNSMPLGQTVHTVGQRLTDHQVHCAYIGKYHLDGFDYFGTGKAAPGWDPEYWYDQRDYLQELSPENRLRSRQPKTGEDPELKAEFTFAHRCTNRAVDFLRKHKDESFLLVVSYDEPHDPSITPKEYRDLYGQYSFPRSENIDDTLDSKPEEQRVWAGKALSRKAPEEIHQRDLFGALTFVDSEIGRVLNELDRSAPKALVFYTSDHGGMLKSHRLNGKGPSMYEEITNIPFLVRWRGVTERNAISHIPVSHIDVTPTLLEFFGVEVPKALQGESMLKSIRDPQHATREHVFLEWGRYEVDHDGFGGFQPIRCICDGRYKLSIHLMTSDELYDLKEDPEEMVNLIGSPDHAELRNKMHDKLLTWMDTSRDPFRGYYWGRRAWRKDYPVSWTNHGMTRQSEEDGYLPRELDYDTGEPMVEAARPKAGGAA
jgi:uncharacterized sulfatase